MMEAKKIKTEEEYHKAVDRIEELMNAKRGTPEGEELDLLARLVERYEDRVYPIDAPAVLEKKLGENHE